MQLSLGCINNILGVNKMRQMFKQVKLSHSDMTCILSMMFGVKFVAVIVHLLLFMSFVSLVYHYCSNRVNPFICNVRQSMLNIWGLEMN